MQPRGTKAATKKVVKKTTSKVPKQEPIEQKFELSNKLDASKTTKEQRRESSAGVHFADLYGLCQRRFYFKYVLGLDPVYTDKALIGGAAFHETKAVWYNTNGDYDEAIRVGKNEVEERKGEFYGPEDYDYAHDRLEPMFKDWVLRFGEADLLNYEVLATELEFRLPIPFTPGFVTTQRHDALLRDNKTKKVVTGETKTASTSIDFTFNSVRASSQVAAYYWGGYEVFGKDYAGLMLDVTYWSARSHRPATIESRRSEILTRTEYQIRQMQVDMASMFNEIQSKLQALKTGTPPEYLFRRSTYYCYAYFRRCPYMDICGMCSRDALKRKGDNLKINDKKRTLDSLTYDIYYLGEGALG